MLDFSGLPVIDQHSHPYDPAKATLDPESLARIFYHGMGDLPTAGVKKARHWGATDDLRHHFLHMGVVQTLVCQLSKVFQCPAELEAVATERNRRTSESLSGYARFLYEDAGMGLIAPKQAERIARMILHDNAARLYGLR